MPRIKLAFWHGDHNPGDELDVNDEELAGLRRDGRVAEVLNSEPPAPTGDKPAETAVDGAQPGREVTSSSAEGRSRKAR